MIFGKVIYKAPALSQIFFGAAQNYRNDCYSKIEDTVGPHTSVVSLSRKFGALILAESSEDIEKVRALPFVKQVWVRGSAEPRPEAPGSVGMFLERLKNSVFGPS